MKTRLSFLHLWSLVALFAMAQTHSLHSMDGDDGMPDLEELDLDVEELLLPPEAPHGSRAIINPAQLNIISHFFDGINLTEPLWASTKPEKGRDILYLMPSKITAIEYGGLSCNLFFNMTSKMHLTGSNLLNIDQINKELLPALIGPLGIANIANINQSKALLPFTKKIIIQERKIGTFFQTGFVKGAFILQVHTSLQIGIRNFWLNKKDQEEIKQLNKLLFGESQQFDESNLYRIRAGLGDTRIKVGLNALNSTNLQTDVGLECILPTSKSSKKSLVAIDSNKILGDDESTLKTSINALFNVRDYLLSPEIGNGGHTGLGFYLESKYNLFNGLAEIISRVSFDKFFTANEQRLMLEKKSLTALDLAGAADDAEAQRRIISFGKQYLLPLPYKVDIEPGGIFNGILILNIPYKKWNFRYGYDFYFQQAERFKKIHESPENVARLNFDRARVGTIIQHKLSSETTYRIKNFNNINLDIAFGGDTTIAAHNIGKDWTMYIKLASQF